MTYLFRMLILLIVLTGLVHIFAILATPFFANQKVWQLLSDEIDARKLTIIKSTDEAVRLLGQADPAMAFAVCRFDLTNGPVTLTSEGPTDFWNITIHNTQGEVIYSLHDAVSQTRQLNLEIRSIKKIQENQAEIDNNNQPLPAGIKQNNIPVPFSRPLTEKEAEAAKLEAAAGEDDGTTVKTALAVNQAFVVFRVFKSSPSFSTIIQETLTNAECK